MESLVAPAVRATEKTHCCCCENEWVLSLMVGRDKDMYSKENRGKKGSTQRYIFYLKNGKESGERRENGKRRRGRKTRGKRKPRRPKRKWYCGASNGFPLMGFLPLQHIALTPLPLPKKKLLCRKCCTHAHKKRGKVRESISLCT